MVESTSTQAMKREGLALYQVGNLQDAKLLYSRVCELDPMDAESWFFLGMINGQQGMLEDAEVCFRKTADLQPQRPEVHFNLGNVLNQRHKFAEAEAAYHEAIRLKPDMSAAHSNLGTLLQKQGKFEQALVEHRASVHLAPTSPEAQFNLGNLLAEMGSFADAETAFREVLRLNPGFVDAYNNLGCVLRKLQRFKEAVSVHREALLLNPNSAKSYLNLGRALSSLGWFQLTIAAYHESVRLDPANLEGWLALGRIFADFGPQDNALECYRTAQALDPACAEAKIGEALVLERKGDFGRAYELLKPFLETDDPNFFAALVFAALCRPLGRCDEAVVLLERMLKRDDLHLNEEQQADLHFELGRLYDSSDAFDNAFSHYSRGNTLFGQGRGFDADQHVQDIEELILAYSSHFMAHSPRAQINTKRPIFIVGMPRSGTTLVEQILVSHPAIFGGGELEVMNRIVNSIPAKLGGDAYYPFCVASMDRSDFEDAAQTYLETLTALSADAERVTDKMPENFLHLGLINLIFPEARIIHCVRNPLDTCLSCYFQNFAQRIPYSQDLRALGIYYRSYQKLMRHWAAVLDIQMMEVKYEDVVADLEGVGRAMLAFCGLPWDDQCARFYDAKRAVGTASYDQVRQPIYRRSLDRWKNYEAHLGPLIEALEER